MPGIFKIRIRSVVLAGFAAVLVTIVQADRVVAGSETQVGQGQQQQAPAAQNTASPEALQRANDLFAMLSKDTTTQLNDQLTAKMWPLLEQQLRTNGKLDDATLSELRGEFERIQRANLADMMKDAPLIYAQYLTAEELQDLVVFYRSPTGQKALRVLPKITAAFFQQMQPRLDGVQRESTAAFTRILRERGYMK